MTVEENTAREVSWGREGGKRKVGGLTHAPSIEFEGGLYQGTGLVPHLTTNT